MQIKAPSPILVFRLLAAFPISNEDAVYTLVAQKAVRVLAAFSHLRKDARMLKTLTVALFAVAMSVGVANATHAHKPMMAACGEGQQATARCLCGTGAGAARMICNKGQWCHSMAHVCGT